MPPHVIEPDTDDPDLGNVPARTLALVLHLNEMALRAEGIDYEIIKRVRNRLVFGHPDGASAAVTVWQGGEVVRP